MIGIACWDYHNTHGAYGIVASTDNGLVTDDSWLCSSKLVKGWNKPGFKDTNGDFSTPSVGTMYNT